MEVLILFIGEYSVPSGAGIEERWLEDLVEVGSKGEGKSGKALHLDLTKVYL